MFVYYTFKVRLVMKIFYLSLSLVSVYRVVTNTMVAAGASRALKVSRLGAMAIASARWYHAGMVLTK